MPNLDISYARLLVFQINSSKHMMYSDSPRGQEYMEPDSTFAKEPVCMGKVSDMLFTFFLTVLVARWLWIQ